MSDADSKPAFDKGDRAAIVGGKKGVGVRGSVFWVGENKYGPGMRFGLRGDDGATYWVDEKELGREEDAPASPEPTTPRDTGPVFQKGDSVKIIGGAGGIGAVGQVFWSGASKYGNGMRYGVRVDEESYWVDDHQVEAATDATPAGNGEMRQSAQHFADDSPVASADVSPPDMFDDIPADQQPPEDELPPEAFEEQGLPPEAFEDDAQF